MPPSLVIVADDLTGALDSAAPFAARGARVVVALSAGAMCTALRNEVDVLAVSTDSREIAPEAAMRMVARVAAALPTGARLFKKIDSRLKGNVAAELAALPFRQALVAPAIPAFGRVVQAGRLKGFGIAASIEVTVALGTLAERCEVPDTFADEDMDYALAGTGADLLVGARGLSEALARAMFPRAPIQVTVLPGPQALIVVGSQDPITLAQVDAVSRSGAAQVVPAPNGLPAFQACGPRTIIQAVRGEVQASSLDVARALAFAAAGLSVPPSTLVLTGGATATAVLGQMGIRHLQLLGECLPGVPVAHAGDTTIVAKSGGFGTPQTLLEILDLVSEVRGAV